MRYLLLSFIVSVLIFAKSGEEIFKKRCSSCHLEYIAESKLIKNYENDNRDLNLTAPTATEISFALRDRVGDRSGDIESQLMDIEDFLISYCNKPNRDKSILDDEVLINFDIMSPIKLSEDEAEALAPYLFNLSEKMIIAHSVKRYSYQEALKKAKKENKIVMIEGFIRYCRGCMKMDREVFVEDRVKEALNRDFVVVKKNVLKERLPLGLKSIGTPAFYFITNDGKKVIDMIQGTGTVDEFLAILDEMKKNLKDKKFLKSK